MRIFFHISASLFLLTILLESCQLKKDKFKKIANGNSINNFNPPIIADTLPRTNELKRSFSINVSYPSIETVQSFGDTCLLKNDNLYDAWDTSVYKNRMEQRADGLQFLVDTNQNITIKYYKDHDYGYPLNDTTQIYYKGYPCFIYNETSQIKWLKVQDFKVIVIQEAMDSSYNWRPIQIWNWSWCGNSYYRAHIKPRHYLLFKVPLYEGNYYADLRLKLYGGDAIYYSNIYKGWINYKQFDLPKILMDDYGNPGFNLNFINK